MKVTYQTCCGVDVHKSFLVATIIKTTSGVEPSYQKKRFSTFNNSILQFKKWLLENQCGRPQFNAMRRRAAATQAEQVGAQLRGMMSFLKKK